MNEVVINPEFFSLASQLYVRMRRSGRVVDAVYMAKNKEYAREILQLAAQETDKEILDIVQRFEGLLARDDKPVLKEPEVIAVPEPVVEKEKEDFFSMTLRPFKRKAQTLPDMPIVETVVTVNAEEVEEEVAHHYVGALR